VARLRHSRASFYSLFRFFTEEWSINQVTSTGLKQVETALLVLQRVRQVLDANWDNRQEPSAY
tara:strand:+ start:863 stop:1051 length:189 start_codon:yes stop_codon:yes gene_type:complete